MLYFLDLETSSYNKCTRQDLDLRPGGFRSRSHSGLIYVFGLLLGTVSCNTLSGAFTPSAGHSPPWRSTSLPVR